MSDEYMNTDAGIAEVNEEKADNDQNVAGAESSYEQADAELSDMQADDEAVEIELSDEDLKRILKKQKRKGFWSGVIAAVLVIIVVTVGFTFFKYVRSGIPIYKLSSFSSGIVDKNVFKKIEGLYATIENTYLDEVDKDVLREGIYKGMVDALGDPYSVYYTEDEFKQMMESSSGSFEGIGAYLQQDPDTLELTVSRPMKGSPAEEAGLLSGDIIIRVDDEDITSQDINVIVSKIKGPAGSTVKIDILRKGKEMSFDIVRRLVYEQSVSGSMMEGEDGIGYIYITEFADDTANQFRDEMNALKDEGATSLIIDLRDNGGGYVDVCADIADMILPECRIVTIKDKHNIEEKYDSSDSEYIKMPIVVLVNENTASASEILTGALKDNDYATVVGTLTFGKGIVQNVLPLSDGTGLKVTIAKYYTPSGVCIHKTGIEPDVEIELDYDRLIEGKGDNQLDKAIEVIKGMK